MKGIFKKEIAQILAITLMVQSFSGVGPIQVSASEISSTESVKMEEDYIEEITDDVEEDIIYTEETIEEEQNEIKEDEMDTSDIEKEQKDNTDIEIDGFATEEEKTTEEGNASEETDVVAVGIEIESEPTKTVYSSGEELDITGLLVNVIYSDNSKTALESSEYQVSGFDTSVIGEQIIQVKYKEYTENFSVEVWIAHGTCGTNLTWTLDDAGKLKISGTGYMAYWRYSDSVPWYSYRQKIKSVVLENEVVSIGRYAFRGCSSLTNIELPESLKTIERSAFYGCSGLTSIELPDGITSIDSDTFYDCINLTNIKLPKSLRNIAAYTFNGCSRLTSIELPDGVASLGIYAFSNCTSLTSIEFSEGLTSLGDYAFYGCRSLTNIDLPEGVTSIGSYAFSGCSGLTSIELPEGVTSIGIYTFSGCSGLTSIELPEGVIGIGSYAFNGCSGLASIELPENLTSVGNGAFNGCSGLTSIELPENLTSVGNSAFYGCSSLTSIELPENLTSVGNSAFYGCSSLTSIELPEGVTSVGDNVFYRCSGLMSIELSKNLTSIGSYAFYGCSGLTGLELPEGLTSIGSSAFYGCSGLIGLELPEGLISIGSYAFNGCSGLMSLELPKGLTSIEDSTFRGCSSLTSIKLPEGLTSIGSSAFYGCSSLTSIELPEGLMIIRNSAFAECSGLTSIELPESLTSIGSYVFSGCSLKSISISKVIENIGNRVFYGCNLNNIKILDGVERISDSAFSECKSLINVELPESIKSIGDKVFYNCKGLASIELPEGLTSIGEYAFYNCSSLTSIELPEGLTSLGDYTFSGCSNLTSIELPKDLTSLGNSVFLSCSSLTSIELPEGLTSLGTHAFNNCKGLTSIELPEGLTSIGEYAFYNCSGLTSIELPEGLTSLGNGVFRACNSLTSIELPKGLTSLGDYTFSGCSNLTSIELPEGLTSLGTHAFNNCKGLTSIELPEGITSLGDYTFSECSNLTSIELPEGLTSLGTHAFNNCKGLTSIELPEGITSIGEYAFNNCSSLTSIELPEGITSIGEYAFYNCSSLTSIELPEGLTSLGNGVFRACNSLTGIELPKGITSLGDYTFSGCSNLTSIELPEGLTSLRTHAFNNCSSLTSIELPEGITSIGEYAFYNCSSLTSIELPEGLTSLRASMFSGCSNLTSIELPEGIVSLGDSVFRGCSKLINISLPKALTSLEDSVFYGCSSLTSIELPEGLTSLGNAVFYNCKNLRSINLPESLIKIGAGAFYNCSRITVLKFGKNVATLGNSKYTESPFAGMTGITKITFNSLEVPAFPTGANTFSGLNNLKVIYVPQDSIEAYKTAISLYITDSVKILPISEEIVADHIEITSLPSKTTYVVNEEVDMNGLEVSVVYSDGSKEKIDNYKLSTVDTSSKGEKVVTISYGTYDEMAVTFTITVLPSGTCGTSLYWKLDENGVLTIYGTGSMSNYKSQYYYPWYSYREQIKKLVFETGITSIGRYAFEYYDKITGSVSIPETVSSIGDSAFYGCSGIEEVIIEGENVSKGSYVFGNMSSLRRLVVSQSQISRYASETYFLNQVNFIPVTEEGEELTLTGIKIVSEPSKKEYLVGSNGVSRSGLSVNAVYSDESEVTINNYSLSGFEAETAGEKVITVTHAGKTADFVITVMDEKKGTCGQDINWVLGSDGILTISGTGEMDNYTSDTAMPWYLDKSAIQKVVIKDGITNVGNYAFYNCTAITTIELPETLISIGNSSFSKCTDLTDIELPESVKNIGSAAFLGCSKLAAIEIPNAVISIAGSTFRECSSLTTLKLSESLRSIDGYAFYGCSDLVEVKLPDSITDIGKYAFYNCFYLKSINIPNGMTRIKTSVFENCTRLVNIDLPENLTSIEDYAFRNCHALENIKIPDKVTSIEAYAFYNCDALKIIEIPDKVTTLGVDTFYNCKSLQKIIFKGQNVPRYVSEAFKRMNASTLEKICVPKVSLDSYIDVLSEYRDYMVPMSDNGDELSVTSLEFTPPTKKDYIAGFDLDLTGMRVYAIFSDETKQEVKNYVVSTYDKVTVGSQTLTVSYLGASVTFEVNVYEAATPAKIVNVTAMSDSTGIYLTWSMAVEATTDVYRVYRKAESDAEFVLLAEVEGRETLSYKDTEVEEGIVYEYYITGKNAAELEGEASLTVSETLVTDEEAPVITKISPDNGSYLVGTKTISLTAQDNVGVVKTQLYYSLDEGETWVGFGESTNEKCNASLDTTKLSDGKINIKGIAFDAKGNESKAVIHTYCIDNTGPEQVKGLEFESTSVTITLRWKDVSDDDISYYVVEQKILDGSYQRVAKVTDTLGANFTDLVPGTNYVYRVVGYDLRENRGIVSETITASTQPDTMSPVVTQIRPTSGYYVDSLEMTIKAEDDYNVKTLIIQISKDAVNWTDVATKTYQDISRQRTFSYVCPLDEYEEGSIFVRALALDSSGNESNSGEDAPFVQYMIDRTAPKAPENVKAQGGAGYIEVSWTQGSENDLDTYSVYRSLEHDGEYTKIADGITAINYFDKSVEEETTYYYKVSVKDKAGNESGYSDVVSANVVPDAEKPEIISVYPASGSSLGTGYYTISALVTDNQMLDKVVFEYSNNAVSYSEMSVKEEINAGSANVIAKVPITEFSHGDHLYIRVSAYDKAGNQSDYAGQQYVIDTVAPTVFSVKAGFEEDSVKVTWSGEPSSDLIGYRIYRKTGVNGEYSLLAQKKVAEGQNEYVYRDTEISSEKVIYYYKVESVDSCGNTSFKETDAVTLTDRTIPTAVISCESTMEKGVEYIIDASDSKDNSMIIAYHFDFGDGVTSTDKKAVHKYTEIGEYTITLTVTDDEGNSSSITKTVMVKERELLGTAKIRVIDENGNAVANAPVYFDLGEETQIIKKTDNKGYVSFTADVGKHTIGCVIADNQWLPAKKEIIVTAGNETSIELTMLHYTMIEGSFESKRMTFEEIKAAGIDISKPENQYFIQLDVTFVYEAEKLVDTSIKYNPNTGEIIAPPIIIETPDGGKHQIIPGVIVPDDTEDLTKVISVAYLEVPVGISTLKDFFNVNLHIINNASSEFSMKDNRVTLNLPEGLTLMETESTVSDVTVSIDEIKGQTTETISWLVRSDKTGEYYLSADYSGILAEFNETVYTTFVSSEAIKVYGMADMKLTVEVADQLKDGIGYYNIALKNNGLESAYLPTLDVNGEVLKTELLDTAGENILGESENLPEILKSGHTLMKHCASNVEVEYEDLTYELKEYALTMKNTYGIDVEIVTKPVSDFVEPEKVPLSLLKQPEDQSVEVGDKATFTVEAEGTKLSYQWQYSTSQGKYWTNSMMEGSDTASITVEALLKRNGQQYRCIVSDDNGDSLVSEAAVLTVTEKEPELEIVKQPEDQTVKEGDTAVFAVEVKGTDLSYQWQYSKTGNYWYDSSMEGSDTASMNVVALAKRDGQYYRCVVMNTAGETVYSDMAVLNIAEDTPSIVITEQPKDQSAEIGKSVIFYISAEGNDLSYQWQYSKTGNYWYDSSMEGFDTASMKVSVTEKRNNYQYRCIVTDSKGNSVYSDAAVLTISDTAQSLRITEQPKDQNGQIGDTVSFKVTAEGNALSYQWQYSKTGNYWYDSTMEGSDTASMKVVVTAKRNNYQYRCLVTDSEGNSVYSEAAVLTISNVVQNLKITEQPKSQSAKIGDTVNFQVIAEGKELSYQWQYSKDGNYWFTSTMEGSDTASLVVNVTAKREGQQYRCVVTNESGESIISDAATLSILK